LRYWREVPDFGEGSMAHDTHDEHNSGRGSMDLTDHMKTWLGFWAGVKWSIIATVVILILLAIFRTN
jgi:hypothetical protein